ncbi:MAG: hypothetical protein ABR879_02405 [Methanomassiliicoccales archaeon]|jgi:hypothetical protein
MRDDGIDEIRRSVRIPRLERTSVEKPIREALGGIVAGAKERCEDSEFKGKLTWTSASSGAGSP